MSRPCFALAFARGPVALGFLPCVARSVSWRRAARLVVGAWRRPGARLDLGLGSVAVLGPVLCPSGIRELCLVSVSLPWVRAADRFAGWRAGLGFRLLAPVADRLFPAWSARRWPD